MKHLLLIKDNNSLRKKLVHTLELAHYSVATANSIKSLLKKSRLQSPQLVLWDLPTPAISARDIIDMLDDNIVLKQAAFIFLSRKDLCDQLLQTTNNVNAIWLNGPFTNTGLLNTIKETLDGADLFRRHNLVAHARQHEMAGDCLTKLTVADFVKNRTIQHYKKKQVIYSEGNHPARLFYIEKGKVKIVKTNNDGKELTVGLYCEGDFVGYTALMEGTNYKDSAQAIDESEIAIIPKEEFEELIHTNAEAAKVFIRLLAKNCSEKEEQLIGLAYNSLRKRVADALIMIQHIYCKASQAPFCMHVSREDLANIAGTATESLIRTLSDFKNEKLIKIKDGNIIIPDPGKLQRILN